MKTKEAQLRETILLLLSNISHEKQHLPKAVYILDQNLGYMEYAFSFNGNHFIPGSSYYIISKKQLLHILKGGEYNIVKHKNEVIGIFYPELW